MLARGRCLRSVCRYHGGCYPQRLVTIRGRPRQIVFLRSWANRCRGRLRLTNGAACCRLNRDVLARERVAWLFTGAAIPLLCH